VERQKGCFEKLSPSPNLLQKREFHAISVNEGVTFRCCAVKRGADADDRKEPPRVSQRLLL
jgi:hypothetical protein